jgi:hypothetical protein
VRIVQSEDFAGIDATTDNPDGEIFYSLSGTSSDGEFYLEGSYKCTVELSGVTLTNPSGPAVNIQNGKRIAVSAKKNKVNTLSDGPDEVRATISTGVSVNHLITILIALFGGWIWQALGIETLFILSALLGLCNSAYAATIRTKKEQAS